MHKSKIPEKLGRCGRQNMLGPCLKILDWDWIFGRAVKTISSLGVRGPCVCPWIPLDPLGFATIGYTYYALDANSKDSSPYCSFFKDSVIVLNQSLFQSDLPSHQCNAYLNACICEGCPRDEKKSNIHLYKWAMYYMYSFFSFYLYFLYIYYLHM